MHSRFLLAILATAVAAGTLCPSAQAWNWLQQFTQSPLTKDAEESEVGSVQKAEELEDFHRLRKQIDQQMAEDRQKQKKAHKFLGRFHRAPQADLAKKEDVTQPTTPRPKSVMDEQPQPVADEPGTAPAKELVDAHPEAGEEAGDEREEKKEAKQVPGAHPTEEISDANYFIKRSQSYANAKDYQSALNYVDKALELQPQNWEAWYQKALVFQLAGYDAAAARRYIELLAHRPDMIEAHIAVGMLYRKHGNFDLAEREYKEAIELKYYNFAAHFNLANTYLEQKKYEPALKEYKVCQKLQPNNALVHNNIGVIFQQRNYLEEAAQEFHRAATLDPGNKMFTDNLTSVRTQLGHKSKPTVTM